MERTEIGPFGSTWGGRERVARRGAAFFAYLLGPPLVALAIGTAALGARTLEQSLGWVVHTREVREYLNAALSTLLEAESAQRGYLLTRDESYAMQFASARNRVPAALDSLQSLTADNSVQHATLRDVRSLFDQRLALMDRVLALQKAGLGTEALDLVQSGAGSALSAQIRDRLGRMQAEEERLLTIRTAAGREAKHSVLISIFGSGVLAVGAIGLLRFFTEKEEKQRAARESRLSEQARLLDLSRDAIIVRDASDRIRYWSQGAAELYGYSREEALGRISHELLRTRSSEALAQIRAQLERAGRWRGELRHATKAGEWITTLSTWTLDRDASGEPRTILEANNDITARKIAEDSLTKSRERLEFALRAARIGFWEWNSRSRSALWNDQEFALLGLAPTSDGCIENDAFFERVHPDDRPAMEAELAAAFRGDGDFSREFRICHPTEGVRWLAGRGRVLPGVGGDGVRMIGLNWDISDIKAAHVSLERTNRELAELTTELEQRVAERTRELSEANTELEAFARSVAHDLRAPLRTMQGFATALIEDCADDLSPDGKSFAQRIATAAERMDRLILDLLDYARLSRTEIQIEPVTLEKILRTVTSELAGQMGETGAHLSIEVGSLAVRANRTLLSQVFSNLISNAFKFVRPGTEPSVEVSAEADRGRVRVWVSDNGIGIAPEHQERIFGVFERLHGHERYPGTGIGLAIVRRAVERMGGTVGVVSELNGGSRFWFDLAKAPAEPLDSHAPPADKASP